jgi:multiple sugar transport system ATP-binding protein
MATVTLEQVSKVYPNGVEAVNAVDLDVAEGELMVLVGPSGCGKTTLLRMIAGLEQITSGVCRFGDRIVNALGPKDRDIAMVFQNYALYPHMTVAENIGFALKVQKLPKHEVERRVTDAALILGLFDELESKPSELSGGQRQRVAMGRAIVREPTVFLMDEPLSNLDAKLRVQMRSEVSRIQREVGVATVYVTHDQLEAMTMGDRVTVLRKGRVQQCGDPQTVYDHPQNMFVASFIGSPGMNLFEAALDADGIRLRLGSQTIDLPSELVQSRPGLAAYAGHALVLGLRPEHLTTADHDNRPVLEGDVKFVEALGSDLLVRFSIDAPRISDTGANETDEGLSAGDLGIARVDPHAGLQAGDRASFSVAIDAAQFFDTDTGEVIL